MLCGFAKLKKTLTFPIQRPFPIVIENLIPDRIVSVGPFTRRLVAMLSRMHHMLPSKSVKCAGVIKHLLLCMIICSMLGCQSIPEPTPIEKDGQVYGITKGNFRSRWWNYYERALSFAEGKIWDDAKHDLKAAIAQRDEDQWRARTYGFHFVDYFPHRELGVIYYHQGMLNEAIDELTMSLDTVKTSKAELYLDRARKAYIKKHQLDTQPPEVSIPSLKHLFQTNAISIPIQGIASDDTYVRHIRVGNKDVRVDVSSPEIQFVEHVPLVPGRNNIPVVVTDLMGKRTQIRLNINVDRIGPLIRMDEPAEGNLASGDDVIIKGYVYDEAGVAELTINGRNHFCDGSAEVNFEQVVAMDPKKEQIVVQAKDWAGNVTTAHITTGKRASGTRKPPLPAGEQDDTSPTLQIRNIEKEHRTYIHQAFIEGNIRDDREVRHLFINGKQILNKPGRNIHFSHLVELHEGDNRITIQGIDASGNEETVQIKIKQEALTIRDIGSRLRVVVSPFKRVSIGNDQQLSFGFEDLLTGAMIDRARFSAIERQHLESLLMELKLSQSGLVDENTALKMGRILAADCMLFGNVLERANSVEAYIRIVDCETSQILAAVDVYGEDVQIDTLRMLSKGLELKMTQELPVVEGLVIDRDGDRIIFDLGKNSRIKSGMKLIVYEIIESIRQSQNDADLAIGFREMGQARTQSIMEQTTSAKLLEGSDIDDIQSSQFVITR